MALEGEGRIDFSVEDITGIEDEALNAPVWMLQVEYLTVEQFKARYPSADIVPGMVENGTIAVIKTHDN